MLIVDPRHWLEKDGSIPTTNPRLRRNIIRVARLIEYGGPLTLGYARATLLECQKRPARRLRTGLLFVAKLKDNTLLAFCPTCESQQVLIHNWHGTPWARGPVEPVPVGGSGSAILAV